MKRPTDLSTLAFGIGCYVLIVFALWWSTAHPSETLFGWTYIAREYGSQ